MERRLETISIKYSQQYLDEDNSIKESSIINAVAVVVIYRNIIDGVPQHSDTISIGKNTDYSGYDEKIKKICQIAFED